jgi:DNA-binding MarR family transcriptional regulator
VPTRGSKSKLSPEEAAAWQGFLRANVRMLRELDADLVRSHRLPLSSYDVLINLALAPGRRLRMTELAEQVLLSPSGLTRLIDQLQRDGLVERERGADDGRSVEAVLTPEGRKVLRAANEAHLKRVRELFLDRLSDAQLSQLGDIWSTVGRNPATTPQTAPPHCGPAGKDDHGPVTSSVFSEASAAPQALRRGECRSPALP